MILVGKKLELRVGNCCICSCFRSCKISRAGLLCLWLLGADRAEAAAGSGSGADPKSGASGRYWGRGTKASVRCDGCTTPGCPVSPLPTRALPAAPSCAPSARPGMPPLLLLPSFPCTDMGLGVLGNVSEALRGGRSSVSTRIPFQLHTAAKPGIISVCSSTVSLDFLGKGAVPSSGVGPRQGSWGSHWKPGGGREGRGNGEVLRVLEGAVTKQGKQPGGCRGPVGSAV